MGIKNIEMKLLKKMKVKFFTQIFEIKREDDYPISLEVFFLIKLNSNILWIKWGGV